MPKGLPFNLTDYLQLVDWSGRLLREDKKGYIPDHLPDILQRLNIDPKHFIYLSQHFESPFKNLVGNAYHVKRLVMNSANSGYMASASVKNIFRVLS